MAKADTKKFYVRNPIMIGAHRGFVHVVGYDETKGNAPPYVVPRGHVIEVPTVGAGPVLARWINNKCLEPYDSKLHKDAFLGANPTFEPVEEADDPAPEKPTKSDQSTPIVDETDDLPKVDEPKAAPKGEQAKTIGGRKYS